MARAAAIAVDNTAQERFDDANSGLAEYNRDLRRAQSVLKQAFTEINIDNAGPMNVEKRRKLYQEPIKAFKKAVGEAVDRFAAGML